MKFKRILVTIILISSCGFAGASHIVGGDFTYRWISGNSFEFTLKLYRDCNTPVPFDDSITVGIFNKVTNARADTLEMHLFSFGPVVLSGPAASCIIPPEVCVEQGIYIDTITIPNNPQGYYIVWERCCRNANVVNIDSPILTGLAFYAEMPDPALHNSSPVFITDPLPFVCMGQPLNYDFSATDTNGDALVYELAEPLAGNIGYPTNPPTAILPTPLPGPYASILWTPGYSLANVCGSSTNPLHIDPVSGNLSVTVDYSGIYAMAVIVHEFRNGVEIGLIRREIEFSVIVCPNDPPQLNLSSALPYSGNTFTIYESDTVCFTAFADDAADSVYLYYSGEVFSGGSISPPYATANNDSGLTYAVSSFCWNTKCGQARATPYKVAFTVRDNGCPLPAGTTDSIFINVRPCPVVNGVNLLCVGLRDNATEVIWSDTASVLTKYFNSYKIFRSVNGSPFSLLGSVTDAAISSFFDSTAIDYLVNDYCYYVQGINSCGDAGPVSNTVCTVSQFNTMINYIKQVSVVDSGKIQVTWKDFPPGPYSTLHIYRKENSSAGQYELRATLVHPNYSSWTDVGVNTSEKSYCYFIVNEDYCGNISPASNEGCSVLLKGNSLAYEDYLYWTPYSKWANGVKQYQVFRKPATSSSYTGLIILPDSTFSYRDLDLDLNNGKFKYYVKSLENPGSLDGESLSNEIILSQPPVAFLPNSFTPDGDYLNDTWGITSAFVKTFILKVYNRHGLLVFESDNKKLLWNGTFKGHKLEPGVYVYTLRYTGFENEKEKVSSGTVTLVK